MQAGVPVLACTDKNTDIGTILEQGDFGWWCESNNVKAFGEKINEILMADLVSMQTKEQQYLLDNYTVEKSREIIMGSF